MKTNLPKQYLQAIVKYGSISKAARVLFISQPYLSKYIINLEKQLGVTLINRSASPITLTFAGERYLNYLEEINDIYDNMFDELEAISNMKRGRLTLGIDPILGSHTLHKVLPKFIKRHPGIEIKLIERAEKEVETLLLQQKVDISIGMLPPELNPKLNYERLFEERLILVIPSNHKYFVKQNHINKFNHIDKLNEESFVLLEHGRGLRTITDQLFIKHQINPNIVLEISNAESAFRLANQGVGMTIVPEAIVKNNVNINSTLFTLGEPTYTFTVVITYNKNNVLSPSTQAFLKMAKTVFR